MSRRPTRRALALLAAFALVAVSPAAVATSQEMTVPVIVMSQSLAFQPREIVVAPGTTITWVNTDPFDHTVTSPEGWFDSGLFGFGVTYSLVLTEPGVYGYYCIPHGGTDLSGMAGLIVVDPAAPPPLVIPAPPTEAPPVEEAPADVGGY